MKKGWKIIRAIVTGLVLLCLALVLLSQIPAVQTAAVRLVTGRLEKMIEGDISFDKIHFMPFNTLVLSNFSITDRRPSTDRGQVLDTLLSARNLTLSFSLKGLTSKEGIHLARVALRGGSFTLVREGPGQSNLKRILNRPPKEPSKEKKAAPAVHVRNAEVQDVRFRYINLPKVAGKPFGINWTDLDVTAENLSARNLKMEDGFVTGTVTEGALREKSGYAVRSLSGGVRVQQGETVVSDLRLDDGWSDLSATEFSMRYEDIQSFNHYIEDVRMGLVLEGSRLDSRTLSYFAPSLQGRDLSLQIAGADMEGTVDDLQVHRLDVVETGSGIHATLSGDVKELPRMQDLSTDIDIDRLDLTSEGLGRLLQAFSSGGKAPDLTRYAPGTTFQFQGRVHGPAQHLGVKGTVRSDLGELDADLKGRNLLGGKGEKGIDGSVVSRDLDLGRIAGVKELGACTLRGYFDAGFTDRGPQVEFDSVFVDRLHVMGYDYSNIIGAGTYSEKAFDGRIVSKDPNLNFLFQGLFTTSDKTRNGIYKFYASIGYADLQALHLDKRGVSKASGQVRANFKTVKGEDLIGEITASDIFLESDNGGHDIGNIRIQSHSNNDIHRINFSSRFADGTFVGDKSLSGMVVALKALTAGDWLPSLLKEDDTPQHGNEKYDLTVDFHDSRELLSFVMPGLYISDSTKLRVHVSPEGALQAGLTSPRLAFARNNAKDVALTLDNKGGGLSARLTTSNLRLLSMDLLQDTVRIGAKGDSLTLEGRFQSDTPGDTPSRILLGGKIDRDKEGRMVWDGAVKPTDLQLGGAGWHLDPSTFRIHDGDFSLDRFQARCDEQRIRVDGTFSLNRPDTLRLDLEKFDLAFANQLMDKGLDIGGAATGEAVLISPWKSEDASLLMHVRCDSTRAGGYPLGTLELASSLDEKKDRLRLLARNNLDGKKTVDVNGYYFTSRKELETAVRLDGFEAGCLSPLLKSVFNRMEGKVSGRIDLKGPMDRMSITSTDTRLADALLEVAYTKVPYRVEGPFHVDDTGVWFDRMQVTDRSTGKGTVSGGILFDHLKDFRMDTHLQFTGMECLATTERDNPVFYGNVAATGSLGITGPFNAIQMDVNARTARSGNLHIPIDNAKRDGSSDLLTFKEPYHEVYVDPYEQMINSLEERKAKASDFGIRLQIGVTPEVQAFVEVDRNAGNVLSANGRGNIALEVRPATHLFSIRGDYTLREGDFHFNAMDIAKRDFSIIDGSSIRFNGDIMDSDLNIDGRYSVKASVATLIADTTSVASRRTVNCDIAVTGKLREPQLGFSIDVPDLDPTTQARVQTALNTDDKVQRQLLSLLISGGFLPDEQSGVVNNTTLLYANVAEVMAGQLNSILQKLDIPLDLGLNYEAGAGGTDIFDVAVSTQLLGDRILVNGAFGNRTYRSGSGSDVVGDLDIEIKLDKPGRLRLTLFSHSVDDYTNSLDNSQRNGMGIAFQREFDTIGEFFRTLLMPRRKREQLRQEGFRQERPMKTIRVGSDADQPKH